jgi:ADP-heptose:LPS heptosyltransferase
VQFCRYAVLAREQGARVTLEVPAPLVDLIRTLDEQVQVVPRGAALPLFDLQCPLMSLPHAFGTRLDTVPLAKAYLRADPARQEQWQQRLGPRSRPRLGLVWSGSTLHKNDRYRSIALRDMLPLLQEDFEFHSLHKEYRDQDLTLLEGDKRIHRHEADLRDFADTAALVACLDAVLCVDTSVAHVAAALGRPTFIFIPADHDYRWLMQREDTPWYQSVRLLRQTTLGQWAPEIERSREVLRQALA